MKRPDRRYDSDGWLCQYDEQAAEKVRAPEEGAVRRRLAAEHQVIAAAGADVAAVEHELVRRQPRQARFLVQRRRMFDELIPRGRRRHVDLDDARIGGDLELFDSRIVGRRVAFEHDRHSQRRRRRFNRRGELEVVLGRRHRRQEDVEHAVADLGAERRSHDGRRRLGARRHAVVSRARRLGRPTGAHAIVAGQRQPRLHRVVLAQVGIVALVDPRQRRERQAITHRRVAGQEIHAAVAQVPGPGAPFTLAAGAGERQGVADDCLEPGREDAAQPLALELVVELRVERVDVHRQSSLAPQVIPDVLVSRGDMAVRHDRAPWRGGAGRFPRRRR